MAGTSALVLGAGGLVGQAYHLGVLRALAEVGYDGRTADVVVGTSAGSLVAAALAAGLSAADQAAELLGEPLTKEGARLRETGRTRVLAPDAEQEQHRARRPLAPSALLAAARRPFSVRPAAVVASLLPPGSYPTTSIERGVRRLHGDGWPPALRVCAVRVRDAQRVVFGAPGAPEVTVGRAVAASCSIPAYFAPVRAGTETYVDGGAHSPTNADVVAGQGHRLVVVLSPMSVRRAVAVRPQVDHALRLAVRRYLVGEVRRLEGEGTRVVVMQPTAEDLSVMGINPMAGASLGDVVAAAQLSTLRRLERDPHLVA